MKRELKGYDNVHGLALELDLTRVSMKRELKGLRFQDELLKAVHEYQ